MYKLLILSLLSLNALAFPAEEFHRTKTDDLFANEEENVIFSSGAARGPALKAIEPEDVELLEPKEVLEAEPLEPTMIDEEPNPELNPLEEQEGPTDSTDTYFYSRANEESPVEVVPLEDQPMEGPYEEFDAVPELGQEQDLEDLPEPDSTKIMSSPLLKPSPEESEIIVEEGPEVLDMPDSFGEDIPMKEDTEDDMLVDDTPQPEERYAPLYPNYDVRHRFDSGYTPDDGYNQEYPIRKSFDEVNDYDQYDQNSDNFDMNQPGDNQYDQFEDGPHVVDYYDDSHSTNSDSYIRTDLNQPQYPMEEEVQSHVVPDYTTEGEPTDEYSHGHYDTYEAPANFFNYMYRSNYPSFPGSYFSQRPSIIIYDIKGHLPILQSSPKEEKPRKSGSKQKLKSVKSDGTPKKSFSPKNTVNEHKTFKRASIPESKLQHNLRDQFIFNNSPFHNGGGRPFYDGRQQVLDESFNRNRYPAIPEGNFANIDPHGLNYNDQAYLYSALNRDNRLRYLLHKVFGI